MRFSWDTWVNHCWYGRKRWIYGLWPLSLVFAAIVYLRHKAYAWGLQSSYRSPLTVVVVGNITVGGTGKTPLVIALVRYLQTQEIPVVVVSRGYGRRARCLVVVDAAMSAETCGDEPLVIYHATGAPVVVASSRVTAVRYCERHYPHHVVLCDDGLQHYALERDIEINVIDGQRGFGNGMLLPAGPLREPQSRLRSVDFIVVNGGSPRPGTTAMWLEFVGVRHLKTGQTVSVTALSTMGKWVALTAIGNPEGFFTMLRGLGLEFDTLAFPDHYFFQPSDLLPYAECLILMTQKDAVKINKESFDNIYVLEIAASLSSDFYSDFLKKLRSLL